MVNVTHVLILIAYTDSCRVVPLIASFQDTSNLYLIMDYMPGGDFLGLLIRDNILTESVTKWYIAEMILCIEEAHRRSEERRVGKECPV